MIENKHSEPVRLGLVGLGDWGEHVAQAAERVPGVLIHACYSRSPETRAAFARRHNCQSSPTYEAMLEDPAIEGIIIMTPNNAHREQATLAALYGKHVLVTKPIAATIEDGRAIVRACAEAGVILAVGHQSRREPALRCLKQLLDADELGKPVMAEANISTGRGAEIRPEQWRWRRDECPGGPLIQLGIHHVDTLQYLLGPIRRVQGWQRRAMVQAEIDDVTGTLLEFENGCLQL